MAKRKARRGAKRTTTRPSAPATATALVVEVSTLQLAALLGVHEDRITKYKARGMPCLRPAPSSGAPAFWDAVACNAWVRVQQNVTPAGGANLVGSRARLATVQSERAELELQRRRGELVPSEDVLKKFVGIATAVRARILSMPGALADQLHAAAVTGGSPEIARVLTRALHAALDELARGEDGAAGAVVRA